MERKGMVSSQDLIDEVNRVKEQRREAKDRDRIMQEHTSVESVITLLIFALTGCIIAVAYYLYCGYWGWKTWLLFAAIITLSIFSKKQIKKRKNMPSIPAKLDAEESHLEEMITSLYPLVPQMEDKYKKQYIIFMASLFQVFKQKAPALLYSLRYGTFGNIPNNVPRLDELKKLTEDDRPKFTAPILYLAYFHWTNHQANSSLSLYWAYNGSCGLYSRDYRTMLVQNAQSLCEACELPTRTTCMLGMEYSKSRLKKIREEQANTPTPTCYQLKKWTEDAAKLEAYIATAMSEPEEAICLGSGYLEEALAKLYQAKIPKSFIRWRYIICLCLIAEVYANHFSSLAKRFFEKCKWLTDLKHNNQFCSNWEEINRAEKDLERFASIYHAFLDHKTIVDAEYGTEDGQSLFRTTNLVNEMYRKLIWEDPLFDSTIDFFCDNWKGNPLFEEIRRRAHELRPKDDSNSTESYRWDNEGRI